jgi:hypothetical protein
MLLSEHMNWILAQKVEECVNSKPLCCRNCRKYVCILKKPVPGADELEIRKVFLVSFTFSGNLKNCDAILLW